MSKNLDSLVISKVKTLNGRGYSTRVIAEELNISPQWVRDLKLVLDLMKRSPRLEEFIHADKLSISTALSSYQKYKNEFLNFIDTDAITIEKITPQTIERHLALSQSCFSEDEALAASVNEFFNHEEKRLAQGDVVLTHRDKEQDNLNTIINFWHSLSPAIDCTTGLADLGTVSISDLGEMSKAIEQLKN